MEIIFAHRGASFEAPENTLPAFELALKQGCKAIELDVHLTKDGQIVVCHDDDIERTTDGMGLIKEMTLEELRQRDAGSWFSEEYEGSRIPTLGEVLALCHQDITINIEIKNVPYFHQGIEAKVIEEIKKHDFMQNTIISSFDHQALLRTQHIAPDVKLGVLLANHLIEPWKYIEYSGIKAYSIHPICTFVDEAFMHACHQAGFKVFPFTVDERRMYQYLDELKVDGIFTNIPARFL